MPVHKLIADARKLVKHIEKKTRTPELQTLVDNVKASVVPPKKLKRRRRT
jgi:hypothetical protein